MKITYYGTAAGGGIPEIFCSCRVCNHARENRGKNIRSRSQALIDDTLSIDFSIDSFLHTLYGGLDMRQVNDIIVTHAHTDHFVFHELFSRPQGYLGPINVYATKESGKGLLATIERIEQAYSSGKKIRTSDFSVVYNQVDFYVPFEVRGYRFTPMRARHAESVQSAIYIVEKDEKSILWAHDTGIFHDEVYEYISKLNIRFDFISLDCTLKHGQPITSAHMDILGCVEVTDKLRAMGCVDEKTQIYISHIGHLLEQTHDEVVEDAAGFGMKVAYDGLSVEF